MKISIIDYGIGNLRSVYNAFEAVGHPAEITAEPKDLAAFDKIVVLGVGAFGDAMSNLRTRGWIEPLEEQVRIKGKPFLGLCLGLQLLGTSSTEHGVHHGLGWIKGAVERMKPLDAKYRVPHIGWNDVAHVKTDGLYKGGGPKGIYYFIHSYVLFPEDRSVVSGLTEYGSEMVASVESGNIFATQYHPEKSQKCGLAVIKNFASM